MPGHERIGARSLAMHRAMAEKLRRDPSLLRIAVENLDRWEAAGGRSGRTATASPEKTRSRSEPATVRA